MNIFSKSKTVVERDNLAPVTPREIVLEHAMLLRQSARSLSVIHSSMVIAGGVGCDPSVVQGLVKSTVESLDIAAKNMEALAERAKRSPMGMPAWRFILQIGATMGVFMAVLLGILLSAAWLLENTPNQSSASMEREWIAIQRDEASAGKGKP